MGYPLCYPNSRYNSLELRTFLMANRCSRCAIASMPVLADKQRRPVHCVYYTWVDLQVLQPSSKEAEHNGVFGKMAETMFYLTGGFILLISLVFGASSTAIRDNRRRFDEWATRRESASAHYLNVLLSIQAHRRSRYTRGCGHSSRTGHIA